MLLISTLAYSQSGAWNYLNFECGGYVTEVIPVKYPAGQQPASISDQILYARADVGGIYRSSDHGQNWKYISNYYNTGFGQPGISISELSIQGLAVRHNISTNSQVLLAAWGNDTADARKVSYQSIWRSDNSGGSWHKATINPITDPGVLFGGNNFPVKIGGPCITYDPNNTYQPGAPINMYMGGFGPTVGSVRGKAYLYKSMDDGQNWSVVPDFKTKQDAQGVNGEGIICITMKEGSSHIWVGTTHAILYSTNNGSTWTRNVIQDANPYIKRIILKGSGTSTVAIFTWGYYSGGVAYTGIGKFFYNGTTTWQYQSLTGNWGMPSDLLSAITFGDNENVIFAGQYQAENAIKKSTDDGNTWTAIQLKYDGPTVNKNTKTLY
jgi:hypothetical protein